MQKIEFKSKGETGAIPLSPTILNQMQDNIKTSIDEVNTKVEGKTILSVKLADDYSPVKEQYCEINTWKENVKTGNKLSVIGGKIKVGQGVSKLRISGVFGANATGNERYYFWTRKNGVNAGTWVVEDVLNIYSPIPFEQLIEVEENDIISVAIYNNYGSPIETGKTILIFETFE